MPAWVGCWGSPRAHLPSPWVVGLGAGGRMVLYVLVCVTLNLSLHFAEPTPSPPPTPDLWDPEGLPLGGSVKVGEGRATLL